MYLLVVYTVQLSCIQHEALNDANIFNLLIVTHVVRVTD